VAGVRRLLGQVIAVRDLDTAVDSFERLGLVLSDRFTRKDIGLDTATFGFDGGSYLELVTPVDRGQVVGATVAAFMDNRGEGPYLTCFEVDDVHKAHERLLDAGIPVVGPPQAPPAERGIACDVLWLKPRATAGAFMQLLSFREPGYEEERRTPGVRLLTHAISVADMGSAVAAFERLGFEPWAQYQTERWGLDTTVFRLSDGTNLELVSPTDTSRPAAEAVAKAVRRRGGHGHYMTVFETDDVTDVAKRLDAVGVPTLGPPEPAPAESPWGPCQQLWVHPRATHGAFIEFLTRPDDE
jgi:predicted enzyme related to lactoylglutathione lyase